MFTSARGFRRDCLFEGVRLVRVNSAFGMLFNAALVFCSVLTSEKLLSQTTVSARPNDTSAVLVKLSPPRLSFMVPGDVKLQFQVKPDGSVDSLQLISGPAVLVQRVLDSVRNSQFECRGCKEAVDSSLTFTFRVIGKPDPCCCSTWDPYRVWTRHYSGRKSHYNYRPTTVRLPRRVHLSVGGRAFQVPVCEVPVFVEMRKSYRWSAIKRIAFSQRF